MERRRDPQPPPVQQIENLPDSIPEVLTGLPEGWRRYFRSAAHEIRTVRHRLTSTDRAMLTAATLALHGESVARQMASKAFEKSDGDLYLQCVRLAQSESRTSRAILASLGLTGSHRALSEQRRRAAHATDPDVAQSADAARWDGLL